MFLEEKENVLFGKIVSLVKGLDGNPELSEVEMPLKNALTALYEKQPLDASIDEIQSLKEKYLFSCSGCAFPCGKTTDVDINAVTDEKKREELIESFYFFKEQQKSWTLDETVAYLVKNF